MRSWWLTLSLFWKTFLVLVLLMSLVVALVEGIMEPVGGRFLLHFSGGFQHWHEAAMWGVSIILPALVCGYIFSHTLERRMNVIAVAAARLSRGNLTSRLPVQEHSRDAFDHLAGSFNEMAESLESMLENERRLLTDISHELRSPLARLGVALELLPLKQDAASRETLLLRLEKDVHAMGDMVESLLAGGKERVLALKGPEESVDLSGLLAEVVDDITFLARQEDKTVAADIDPGAVVTGYTSQLRLMLANVGTNALFYTPPGEAVNISLVCRDGVARILIRDHGPGVPDKDLANIFRPFYRVDGSRTRTTGGAGLGLALAREAAALCGGSITARNAGPGLEVCMRFPLTGQS